MLPLGRTPLAHDGTSLAGLSSRGFWPLGGRVRTVVGLVSDCAAITALHSSQSGHAWTNERSPALNRRLFLRVAVEDRRAVRPFRGRSGPQGSRGGHALKQSVYAFFDRLPGGVELSLTGPSGGPVVLGVHEVLGDVLVPDAPSCKGWRDCKPANMVVTACGVYAVDFEGACLLDAPGPAPWGSPGHVPPEWPTSARPLAQDLYALGVVLATIFDKLTAADPTIASWGKRIATELQNEDPARRPSASRVVRDLSSSVVQQASGDPGGQQAVDCRIDCESGCVELNSRHRIDRHAAQRPTAVASDGATPQPVTHPGRPNR